jgi:hypothetical protein
MKTYSGPDADAHDATLLSVEAQAWLAQLPAQVRAHGIAAHAPSLANRLAAGWNDVPCTDSLLESLLCESVRAMPVPIVAELLRLYDYHVRCRVHGARGAAWDLPVRDLRPRCATRSTA